MISYMTRTRLKKRATFSSSSPAWAESASVQSAISVTPPAAVFAASSTDCTSEEMRATFLAAA